MRREAVALLAFGLAPSAGADEGGVHAFLKQTVQLTDAQIAAVERGDVVTKQLPAADKPEMAAFGAVLVNASRETFLARFRDIVRFRRGPSVLEMGRLGDPPRVEAEDFFYWTKDKFGPKPTVALYHVSPWADPDRVVIASKQIYASHYFQAGLDLMALVETPGRTGFYLMDLYRARVDPPTGLLAGVLLGKIRGGLAEGVAEGLRTAKARTEAR